MANPSTARSGSGVCCSSETRSWALTESGLARFLLLVVAALEALDEDDVIREALGAHVFERFMSAKKLEWEDYRLEVTSWELNKYLPIY